MPDLEFTARDVLEELDYDAREKAAFFADFDHGYKYHVDGRLTVYGDARRWAVVIEQLSVNPRAGCFAGLSTTIHYHGNCIELPPQPGWGDEAVKSIAVFQNGPSGPLLDAEFGEQVNLDARDVRIRGQVVPIRTDENYYWARNIEVESITDKGVDDLIAGLPDTLPPEVAEHARKDYETLRSEVGKFRLRTWHLARALVPECRDLLLATETERREGLPADLPMVLQLDDWEHPRLLDGELPSSSSSFKQIAKVIASGNANLYQPDNEGNVHWSHWPNSGSL
jgi:hypothetical protein